MRENPMARRANTLPLISPLMMMSIMRDIGPHDIEKKPLVKVRAKRPVSSLGKGNGFKSLAITH
jgi:hypothetical protein